MSRFAGRVTMAGKLVLDDRRALAHAVKSFAGKRVDLVLERHKTQRSIDQNKWLWGCALPLIADYCGNDHHEHERLHYDLLSVRFGTVAVSPLVPGAQPRIVPTRTSSELNTKEFSDYMEWLVRFAAETWGVVIPLPDERDNSEALAS